MIWAGLVACMVFSLLLTGIIRRFALARDFVDVPNQRSSHSVETPHGGGIAIVLAFQFTLLAFALIGFVQISSLLTYLIAGSWIALIGLIDDVRNIPARWRLLAHFLGAAFALFWIDGLPPLKLIGEIHDLGWIGHLAAILLLVWLLNLYNFMDGIDGIAGIEAITVCLGGVISLRIAGAGPDLWLLPLVLLAAAAGFLFWNFPRARIFMGDSGSAFVGLVIGLFALEAARHAPELVWSWLIMLGCFIVDATVTLLRRVKRGEKFYQAHRSHAYQYAARRHASHARVSAAVGLINLLWLLPLAISVAAGWLDGLSGLVVAYLPLLMLVYFYRAGAREMQEV